MGKIRTTILICIASMLILALFSFGRSRLVRREHFWGGDLPMFSNADELAFMATDVIMVEVLGSRTEPIFMLLDDPANLDEEYVYMFTQIHTINRIRVLEVFRGEAVIGDTLDVMQPGGRYRNRELIYYSQQLFENGDVLVIFAQNHIAFGFGHLPMTLVHPWQSVFRAVSSSAGEGNDLAGGIAVAYNANPALESVALERFSPWNDVVVTIGDLILIQYESGLGQRPYNLQPPVGVDRSRLIEDIARAEHYLSRNYIPSSWGRVKYLLEEAIHVRDNPYSRQIHVNPASSRLRTEMFNLGIDTNAPVPSPRPTPTPTPTPRPGTTHPSEDEGTTSPAATPTPRPPTTPAPSTPSGEPSRTTTTNPETGETITLNHPTTNLPDDFLSDILNRDPVNEILLDETFQLTPNNTPARIGIYVGDQNLSDEQLVALAGFILNPQTGQYEIIRGYFCQDSNTFYVEFDSAGIVGIILYERPTPLLRFTIGQVRYYHNGQPLTSDVAPFLSGGRTMVPIRIISEALGATPEWDDATQTAYIHKGEVVLRLPMGQPLPGGLGIPELINSRVLVPARFVIENFNAITLWNAELQVVTVYVW